MKSSRSGVASSGRYSKSGVDGILYFEGLMLNLRNSGVMISLLISFGFGWFTSKLSSNSDGSCCFSLAITDGRLDPGRGEASCSCCRALVAGLVVAACCFLYWGEYELNEPKRGESSISSVSSPHISWLYRSTRVSK